jgi:DGQHR domain-containing protein
MNGSSNKVEFYAIAIEQRDFSFYIAALQAAQLLPLCSGWRDNGNFGTMLLRSERIDEDSALRFVDAVQTSDFARAELNKAEFEDEAEQIAQSSYEQTKPFQRLIDETRVNKIGAYLREEDALMPNPVILATREDTVVDTTAEGSIFKVTLTWSGDARPINIIDGQHRVEALRKLINDGFSEFEEFMVPFSLVIDSPYYMQAELFAIINGRQKAVNRSLIYDLLGYIPIKDQETRDKIYKSEVAVHRFCHKVVKVLNLSNKSPWHLHIKMRGAGTGIVSQAAFVDHLAELVQPRSKRASTLPVLFQYFRNNDLVGLSRVCVLYFLGISKAWPQYWQDEKSLKNSLFGKTNGIAVMFRVLHDLTILVGGASEIDESKAEAFWKNAPEDRIANPPAGGGRKYQKEWYEAIMRCIVGDDFRSQIAERLQSERKRLEEAGALI